MPTRVSLRSGEVSGFGGLEPIPKVTNARVRRRSQKAPRPPLSLSHPLTEALPARPKARRRMPPPHWREGPASCLLQEEAFLPLGSSPPQSPPLPWKAFRLDQVWSKRTPDVLSSDHLCRLCGPHYVDPSFKAKKRFLVLSRALPLNVLTPSQNFIIMSASLS